MSDISKILWYPREPEEVLAEANAALDQIGLVMTNWPPQVAPDFVMRTVVAAREGLARHRPVAGENESWWCACGWTVEWPCLDVLGWLSILGISATEGVE